MLRLTALLLLFTAVQMLGQNEHMVTGDPENSLAGIELKHTQIADIEKMYGPRSAMIAISEEGYPVGTKLYRWGRLTVTLKVLTEPEHGREDIRDVEVRGEGEPGNRPINRTGRGLALGGKVSEIKKYYGVAGGAGTNILRWPGGTMLLIDVSEKQRISRIELRAPTSDRSH